MNSRTTIYALLLIALMLLLPPSHAQGIIPGPIDGCADVDFDGVCWLLDNCPETYNPPVFVGEGSAQPDRDGDGLGDACDPCPDYYYNDEDNDGICGDVDPCRFDPLNDQDNDGICANFDICPADPYNDEDKDGFCGNVDNCPTLANANQLDGDNDGLGNVCDLCPADPNNDVDKDGICGNVDNCPAVPNADQKDYDEDGLGNVCDQCGSDPNNDVDKDGVCANVDNCPTVANFNQLDGDNDGLGDACDACPGDPSNDVDKDGVCGDVDNCPTVANADQLDENNDGRGNACEECNDFDNDGVCAANDNCPNHSNPDQQDFDCDGQSEVPVPDIKLNGGDAPLVLIPPSELHFSLALDSRGITEAADWWLALSGPPGILFFTAEGWKSSMEPAYSGLLFDLPPLDLVATSFLDLPPGQYAIYFGVDFPADGIISVDQLYWDAALVNLASGLEDTGEKIGAGMGPLYMYYLERFFSGVPPVTELEKGITSSLVASQNSLPYFENILAKYSALPEHIKYKLFDPVMVDLTSNSAQILDMNAIISQINLLNPAMIIPDLEPPSAPTGIIAQNASIGPDPDTAGSERYQIGLDWQDQSTNEDGFLIYRNPDLGLTGVQPQMIATVGPNVTTFLDDTLSEPANEEDVHCYRVTAYKRSPFNIPGQDPIRIESNPSNTACATYSFLAPPFIDSDKDGIPDDLDECPFDHAEGAAFTNGCPDDDGDYFANKDDACKEEWGDPPVSGDMGPVPNKGCPYRYQIRWMGMEILNNSAPYAYFDFTFGHWENGQFISDYEEGQDPFDYGEEPYLIFAFVNGMTPMGMKQYGTSKWCCGERVDVKKGFAYEPDNDSSGEENPLNLPDLLRSGFTIFPSFSGMFGEIDPDLGITITTSLMERDWEMTITPDNQVDALGTALATGGAIGGGVASCAPSGGFGCLLAIGGALKGIVDTIFGLSQTPDPIIVQDPDDYMGTAVWGITRSDARFKTSKNGVYGFWFDMPVSYYRSADCIGWNCPDSADVPVTMRVKLYFCLYREGVSEANLRNLCMPYTQVLPWPMRADTF